MDSIDSKEPAKGYLLFQKELLEVLRKLSDKPLTEREASFVMFFKANYKDEILEINRQKMLCRRGESVLSKSSWAKVFNWPLGKTRYFFKKLVDLQLIAIVPHRNLFSHPPAVLSSVEQARGDKCRTRRCAVSGVLGQVPRNHADAQDQCGTGKAGMGVAHPAREGTGSGGDRHVLLLPHRHPLLQAGGQLSQRQNVFRRRLNKRARPDDFL